MQPATPSPPSRRLLKLRSVLDRVACSKTEWYRRIQASQAPKPIQCGARAVAWLESDIDNYINSLRKDDSK